MSIVRNYTLRDFERDVDEAKEKLVEIGYEEVSHKHYYLEFNTRSRKRFGSCLKKSETECIIELNKLYSDVAPIEEVRSTIMHELIHSIKSCYDHGRVWKGVVTRVNNAYGYNIKTGKTVESYTNHIASITGYKYSVRCNGCKIISNFTRETKLIKKLKRGGMPSYRCCRCKSEDLELLNN